MDSKMVGIALIALLIGGGIGYAVPRSVPADDQHVMPNGTVMEDEEIGMEHAMDEMTADLAGKTGDAFDQAFLAGMIVHHQGAVAMAQAALQYAQHPEIKAMAEAIISAQTAEIMQMQQWESDWYGQ